jgi:hypothetical protein
VLKNVRVLVFALGLIACGFLAGWTASRRFILSTPAHLARAYLTDKGDAPEAVRHEVLKLLRAFQDGYVKRDVRSLDRFASQLFFPGTTVVVLGTDPGEWINGYAAVKHFIKSDWLGWGDLRLLVDDTAVYSSGDVAWLATVGSVTSGRLQRPIRLTAVMTRTNARWLFRQIQFQWDERPTSLSELLAPARRAGVILRY